MDEGEILMILIPLSDEICWWKWWIL